MNPVKALQEDRQAVWLDFASLGFVAEGSGDHIEPKA